MACGDANIFVCEIRNDFNDGNLEACQSDGLVAAAAVG